jgi:hypothetical protein
MALKFPRSWPWSQLPDPPDPRAVRPTSILLASEGKRIPAEALEFVVQLSRESAAPVLVFTIARIWGSAFGLPHPSLMPTRREWQVQRDFLAEAVDELKRRGVEATGKAVSSRNAAKRIVAEAKRRPANGVIVMAAPPPRHWILTNLFWDQEPYRVRRRAASPVYLVVAGQPAALADCLSATGAKDGDRPGLRRRIVPEINF